MVLGSNLEVERKLLLAVFRYVIVKAKVKLLIDSSETAMETIDHIPT